MTKKNDNCESLVDSFGRAHTSLRVSVTDRCNIRCFYCMPEENVVFKPRHEILTFDEIEKFVSALVPAGVSKLRITGGEPLVRSDIDVLIKQLASIDGITDLAMTTNGILLADYAERLHAAGLKRLNISIDSLSNDTFFAITRRNGLDKVIAGIDAVCELPFEQVRLNAIAIKDLTENEIVPLAKFAFARDLELRFIEFMPLDADGEWQTDKVLSGGKIRSILESEFGELTPAVRQNPSQPATDYSFVDGNRVGFINSVTEPFCEACDRLRITAEGKVRNCLFSTVEWDARQLIRDGGSPSEIRALVYDCVRAKKAGHGIDTESFQRPERAMYQIGG